MPRRKRKEFARKILPDPRFGSELVQKLINVIMDSGKKNISRHIVYFAFDILIKKLGDEKKAMTFFLEALDKISPRVEVRPRRVGGSVYQVPTEVRPRRKESLTFRWLINAAKARSNKTMGERLAYEIIEAHDGRGAAVKKRTDVQKMAEANRAFSHFAW